VAGNSTECGRSVTSKIVAILLTFTDGDVHTLTEVARLAGMPTSTVHRLIGELAAWGLLERTDDAQYRVGAPLREIGAHAPRLPGLHERARRVMEDLSAATRTDVRLGLLAHDHVGFIEKVPGNRPVSRFADGGVVPAHATAMGKALLAFAPPAALELVIAGGLKAYTPHTLTTVDGLRRALSTARLSRMAISRWELIVGVSTMAVPVFGGGGTVVAALELRVPDLRNDLRVLHPVLVVAARSLSRELATTQSYDRSPLIAGQWGSPVGVPAADAMPVAVGV
jgi:IclR family acetate operon transcriptional repressor